MSVRRHKRVRGKTNSIDLGLLQMQILWMIHQQKRHGYELMKELNMIKKTKITQGTLYPALKKLENMGMVRRKKEKRKITYQITKKGLYALNNSCEEFCKTFHGIFHDYICGKCGGKLA